MPVRIQKPQKRHEMMPAHASAPPRSPPGRVSTVPITVASLGCADTHSVIISLAAARGRGRAGARRAGARRAGSGARAGPSASALAFEQRQAQSLVLVDTVGPGQALAG